MNLQLVDDRADRLHVAALDRCDEAAEQFGIVHERLQQFSELDDFAGRRRRRRQLHADLAADADAAPDAQPEADANAVGNQAAMIERLTEGVSITGIECLDGLREAALVFSERGDRAASLLDFEEIFVLQHIGLLWRCPVALPSGIVADLLKGTDRLLFFAWSEALMPIEMNVSSSVKG